MMALSFDLSDDDELDCEFDVRSGGGGGGCTRGRGMVGRRGLTGAMSIVIETVFSHACGRRYSTRGFESFSAMVVVSASSSSSSYCQLLETVRHDVLTEVIFDFRGIRYDTSRPAQYSSRSRARVFSWSSSPSAKTLTGSSIPESSILFRIWSFHFDIDSSA